MNHWLMKSEPSECSIDDVLALPSHTVPWFGVRNYLARNYMRDQMRVGDRVLFYHSSCPEPGVAGIARVASTSYPDPTQFDRKGKYFDPKSRPDEPRWMLVDVQATQKTRLVSLVELRAEPQLDGLVVLARGNRLSITPVSAAHYALIVRMAGR